MVSCNQVVSSCLHRSQSPQLRVLVIPLPLHDNTFQFILACDNLTFFFQTITLDGGEFPSLAGEFNKLTVIKDEQWDMMAEMIKASNKKSKGGEKSKM